MMKLALIATLLVMTTAPALAVEVRGVATVIDADTLEIHGQRIRLQGIDAVEGGQLCTLDGRPWRCGRDAALAIANRIGKIPLVCVGDTVDRYGRTVAVCYAGGEDLNGWAVREGWALAYRRFSSRYVPHEIEARAARRGLWSSEFMPPWVWRHAQWDSR